MRKSVLLVAAVLVIPFGALAQKNPSPQQSAEQHYKVGTQAYNGGDYAKAVQEYLTAYQQAPLPGLLFNIGQAYRLSGDKEKALSYYEKYVEFEPGGAQVPDAKQYIASIKETLETARREREAQEADVARQKAEEEAKAKAEADAKAKAEADARARDDAQNAGKGLRVGGLVLAGVGVAAAGVGIAVAAGGSTGAGVGIAAGGAAALGTGLAMYFIGKGKQHDAMEKVGQPTSMIVPAVAPGYAGAVFTGTF